jgi:pimeloyl-ACP methyl ester carboxylesterase
MPTLDIFRIAVRLVLISIQFASTPALPDQPPPPGRLVDLGDRKLHLYCTGKGSPTVILETGAGSFSIDWALVQPEVAQRTRVSSYDRAGYGWSAPGPEWDSVTQVANDLETGLSKASTTARWACCWATEMVPFGRS